MFIIGKLSVNLCAVVLSTNGLLIKSFIALMILSWEENWVFVRNPLLTPLLKHYRISIFHSIIWDQTGINSSTRIHFAVHTLFTSKSRCSRSYAHIHLKMPHQVQTPLNHLSFSTCTHNPYSIQAGQKAQHSTHLTSIIDQRLYDSNYCLSIIFT